ncbi:MAG: T9SS type A sorting domain-containing protein [Bacteroidales bacterium]|nr:T9SS type A sorting domain-containing protein [Bacteroidales bacterium]
MKFLHLFFILFLSISSIGQSDTTKVLFLGNSFTGVNNLPSIFEQLAIKGGKKVLVSNNAPGGYTISGHVQNSTSLQLIDSEKWDFVVIQEQSQIPSMIPERDSLMYPYAIQLDTIIHAASVCTKTTFFMTWAHKNGNLGLPPGSDTYEAMQQRLRSGYMTIADSLEALVAPVGWAWRTVRQQFPNIELYMTDDYHPAMAGTYLAACVFYATFFQQTPMGINYTAGLDTQTIGILQNVAQNTVLDSLALWNHGVYNPNPEVDFNHTITGYQIDFQAITQKTDSVFWSFGDGTTSTTFNPTHQYSTNGTYEIMLIGKNDCSSDSMKKQIVILPSSMSEIEKELRFDLLPNPASTELKIFLNDFGTADNICIYSADGRLILRQNAQKGQVEFSVDIRDFTSGIYFLEISNSEGLRRVRRFVKH